jgi:8-amino-7-oxononanoate synthase
MREAFLLEKLNERRDQQAFRKLKRVVGLVDFCSNDYLGLAGKHSGFGQPLVSHGSTGSRLLTGNSTEAEELESQIADFHQAEAALLFNSGYDANLGLLSAVPRKADHIFYDQLSHASIRDGVRLSFAQSTSFRHNDMDDLEKKLSLHAGEGEKFVVTETVFSMDGDFCPLERLSVVCNRYNAHLILDEAHALGVVGNSGIGLSQSMELHDKCFARVYTFGKAAGAHGAAIAGSATLKDFLINFSRPFIYTTALPPAAILAVKRAYELFPTLANERNNLSMLIRSFQQAELKYEKLLSSTAIQGIIVPGNDAVKEVAMKIREKGMDVRPILYPTVPKGRERLRIVLHSFNTAAELGQLIACLQ